MASMNYALLGMPLANAIDKLNAGGIAFEVVPYFSKRGKMGEDMRVIRVSQKGEALLLVVSAFTTKLGE